MGLAQHYVRFPRAASKPWAMPSLCKAYGFPQGVSGPDQVIGIVELGGGYKPSDIVAAFKQWGLPAPVLTDVSVDGGKNAPGSDADIEVILDVEIAAAAYSYCTGKPAVVRVYFAPNTDAGFMHAVSRAAADGCATISISWGAPEGSWGKSTCLAFDSAAASAVAQGSVIFAASGDNLSDDGNNDGKPDADFPAASPHVVGCGGTAKTPTAEVVWNEGGGGTGGGYSTYFGPQAWQTGVPANAPGRMVPDVAANADPATGYSIYADGGWTVVGGTSAVAPLYAGLFAAVASAAAANGRPKLGNVLGWLYQHPAVFADITSGNNGDYRATTGADPCTGLGVPKGTALFDAVIGTVKPPQPPAPPPPTPQPPPSPVPVPPPTKPPEPPVSQSFTINVPQQPVMIFGQKLGYVPAYTLTGKAESAAAAVEPAVTIPPELWALLFKYGRQVLPIVLAGVFAKKPWKDILADVLAAVAAGQLAA